MLRLVLLLGRLRELLLLSCCFLLFGKRVP
jgi:hypothetical protein